MRGPISGARTNRQGRKLKAYPAPAAAPRRGTQHPLSHQQSTLIMPLNESGAAIRQTRSAMYPFMMVLTVSPQERA